jgi:hypothetical protein
MHVKQFYIELRIFPENSPAISNLSLKKFGGTANICLSVEKKIF